MIKNILVFCVILFSFLILLMILLYLISTKSISDREKISPFECGFDPFESSRIPFSSHFFLIAVIFLVFDVELVIIMPMIILMPTLKYIDMYIIMTMFLFILIIGLYHEWNNKMLDWM
uniref:NADH-ubiquinone oxidoreductase chain 3 n=1 Tax=Diceroprocta semicincta TaxID=946270 RepID=A0A088DQP0_9HEMI|nr:NADH dehydrogenase subunit 3 [Diceroprocta semicincta]